MCPDFGKALQKEVDSRMDSKLKVILNPSSGQGRGGQFASKLQPLLAQHRIDAEIIISQSESHMRELFAGMAQSEPLLVAVGGDTTFTMMAQELWRVRQQTGRDVAEMAWIGVGTANDILLHVGLHKIQAAVMALKKGQTLNITLAEITDDSGQAEIFLGSVSFGAAPKVNEAISRARKRGHTSALMAEWGPGLISLKQAFRSGELPLDFELEPRSGRGLSGTASLILILNIPHFSRGIPVNNFAALDTPFIDWTVLSCQSLSSLWLMQQRLARFKGEVIHEDIQVGQSREGRLILMTPQFYLVDGELRGPTRELSFRAIPEALKLRVPEEKSLVV